MLRHRYCGILGFCSDQEMGVRGKVWQTLVTQWFELIGHELLLLQRHEIVDTEGHVTRELPLWRMAVVQIASKAI